MLPSESMQCGFAADERFGPSVSSCRREFDFTILFEEIVLVIVPSCTFVVLAAILLLFSRRRRLVVRRGQLHAFKLVSATALALAQIAILAVQARLAQATTASIPSAAVALVSSLFVLLVSHVEHLKSLRPSTLLVSFLTLTSIFDAARTRTYWLSGEVALAAALSVALGCKLATLYLESLGKQNLLLRTDEKVPVELLAGPISRTVFHWLNKLLVRGYRGVLSPEDLGPVDDRLLSAGLRPRFQRIAGRYSEQTEKSEKEDPLTSNGLIWLTLTALGRRWTGPIIARLAVTAFTFTQPFLASAALQYLQADDSLPDSRGYGLIGAAFFCYVGIAAATSWYWHQAYRCAVMVRGGLAIATFEKLLRLPEDDKIESVATTLMVEDLQRIMTAATRSHEVWAGTIETGLATWLLYRELGPSCFVMIGITAVAGLGSMQILKKAGGFQQKWLVATQKRLKQTKQVLNNLKGIKMASQDSKALISLNELRRQEISDSSSFRWIALVTVFLSYCPLTLSPPIVFAVYVGTSSSGYDFSVSKVFTSLIIITLLSAPLVHLFQVIPQLGGAYGCFQRLHSFMELKEKTDYRETILDEKSGPERFESGAGQSHVVSLQNLSLGWDTEGPPLLKGINLQVRKGVKIAIIGPVGSGKSLLLKGIIGEAYTTHGQIALAPSISLAYCSQTPWLENISAQQNMSQYGRALSDSDFYRQLSEDCLLDDVIRLPTFASGSIGSGGVNISGGQRQRLALARALSTGSDVLILDDVFSALDRTTRWHIATKMLTRSPVRSEKTIIYSTHDDQIANLADEVYQLDESGHLSRRTDLGGGSVAFDKEVVSASSDINLAGNLNVVENSSVENKATQETAKARAPLGAIERQAAKQQLGDTTVYKTYFQSVGWLHSTVFALGAMAWSISYKFSDIWIQWWSDASETGDHRLGYWLGIYTGLGVVALLALSAWVYHQQFNVISRSGKRLHSELATTVVKAQFPVISQIDTGTTLNRFSQDLMFVDMQLPIDLLNTSSELTTAIIQVVLISIASKPALCAVPVVLILLYLIQHFYLRTSKQLRLQELEAKAAIITKIAETSSGNGLSTIRAHGWSDITTERFLMKLDRSQEPLYLLYAAQRWLQLVLNLVVAGIVVVVLGACIALKTSNKVSAGAAGVAFLNAVTLGETLTHLILAWTGLETSLGAIARIALFKHQTPVEEDIVMPTNSPSKPHEGAVSGPSLARGAIRFENVWATYSADTNLASKVSAESPDKKQEWSLRGVNLDIKPGERIAVCGKTGSGKSTMHLALLRMVNIPLGSIFIDNVDHGSMSLETLRKGFLVISQDRLGSFSTLREEVDPQGLSLDASIEDVLHECGILDKILSCPGGLAAKREDCKFSAGEEQLLSVARVVLEIERDTRAPEQGGRIVLLDEVTSSIDKGTEEKMEFLLRTRLGGRTLIAINHRLESVLDYDRILVLDNGMVADFGTPAELLLRCDLFAGLEATSRPRHLVPGPTVRSSSGGSR